jgi:elongation factor Tu
MMRSYLLTDGNQRFVIFYEYDGHGPVIQGSALGGLNNDPTWVPKILELMEVVDA